MSNKQKPNKLASIIAMIVLSVLFTIVIVFFMYSHYVRFKSGWTANDSVLVIFEAIFLMVCIVTILQMSDYIATNDELMVIGNNKLYRSYKSLESSNQLEDFKNYLITEEHNQAFKKINSYIGVINKKIVIDSNNVRKYFDNDGNYIGSDSIESKRILRKLKKFYFLTQKDLSLIYESVFCDMNSGEILKKKSFPLFNIILPLFIGALGVFTSIYQILSIDGSVTDSFVEYLIFFVLGMGYSIGMSFAFGKTKRDFILWKKNKILNDMNKILEKDNK